MTNKITKEFLFTELSIKIATLEMKLNKILELLNSPEVVIQPAVINVDGSIDSGFYKRHWVDNNHPPQWPNESFKDYMKRIGQYNEAQSEDEQFTEKFK